MLKIVPEKRREDVGGCRLSSSSRSDGSYPERIGAHVGGDGAAHFYQQRRLSRIGRQLFSESPARFVATVRPDDRRRFEQGLGDRATLLGTVIAEPALRIRHRGAAVLDLSIDDLHAAWSRGLEL